MTLGKDTSDFWEKFSWEDDSEQSVDGPNFMGLRTGVRKVLKDLPRDWELRLRRDSLLGDTLKRLNNAIHTTPSCSVSVWDLFDVIQDLLLLAEQTVKLQEATPVPAGETPVFLDLEPMGSDEGTGHISVYPTTRHSKPQQLPDLNPSGVAPSIRSKTYLVPPPIELIPLLSEMRELLFSLHVFDSRFGRASLDRSEVPERVLEAASARKLKILIEEQLLLEKAAALSLDSRARKAPQEVRLAERLNPLQRVIRLVDQSAGLNAKEQSYLRYLAMRGLSTVRTSKKKVRQPKG